VSAVAVKEKSHIKQVFDNSFGELLLASELAFVRTWLGHVGGVEMVVTGISNEPVIRLVEEAVAINKILVVEAMDADETGPGKLVIARPDRLPFRSDSIDLLIALHTLQQTEDPRRMVREVERVLAPEGRVIFSGLNPYSLAGLWGLATGGRLLNAFPLKQSVSRHMLCDWLLLLGLEIEKSVTFGHRPPLKSDALLGKLALLDKLGDRAWPFFGAGYLVQAKKHVSNLIPLAPARPWRSRLVPGGVATSFNRSCEK
jgi:SAM-dependent methyltransferase